MPAEGRRRATNVDRDVQDPSARATHQLVLRKWRRLEVQPTQGANHGRERMIVLYESKLKTGLVPVGPIVHLRKKPPGVAVFLRRHDLDRWNRSIFNLHQGPPSFRPIGPGAALLPEAAARGHPRLRLPSQPRPGKFLEGPGAMRQGQRAVSGNPVLFLGAHLAEGSVMAIRAKDGIVAKSGRPARRENEDTVHLALESFDRAIRPG